MHKNTFVLRSAGGPESPGEQEYTTVKDAFDEPGRRGRGVWIKARREGGAFVGYFGPVRAP